jgi:hypothetical protein
MTDSLLDTRASVVDVPLDLLRKVARSVEQVHERMLRTRDALKQAGIPFAVIGGNAVAIWVESKDEGAGRTTKDVDIVLFRQELERAKAAMDLAGFEYAEVTGVTMFVEKTNPSAKHRVHVLFIGEKVRADYKHPVPGLENMIESPEGVPTIGIFELLKMKLQSFRDRDRAHIRDMLGVKLLTQEMIDRLPPDMRERMDQILKAPESDTEVL